MLSQNVILASVLIFVIRVFSITLSTVRLLIMGRSSKILVSAIAFIEALTFALTFGVVASDLTNIWFLMSYCGGFAGGTWVGMMLESRLSQNFQVVNIISMGKSQPIAEAIRDAGYGATRSAAEGISGTVGLVFVVVRRVDSAKVVAIATDIDPKAFVTVNEARSVTHGFITTGRS
jgi:uncharacterized protein YebE (UPF0316 family)